jgi:hypothetical protein
MVLGLGTVPFTYAADPKSDQERFTRQIGSEVGVPEPGSLESLETPKPAKPRGSHLDGTMRSTQPPYLPGQTPVPRERTRALEERLRSGQMERPIAQGQISDRLEQLHSGTAEGSSGNTATGQ